MHTNKSPNGTAASPSEGTRTNLPLTYLEFSRLDWAEIEPHFHELEKQTLNEANLRDWLAAWTRLEYLLDESYWRTYMATMRNTADPQAQQARNRFLEEIYPPSQLAGQRIRNKFLQSGLSLPGLEIPIRNLHSDAALFHPDNVLMLAEEFKLIAEFDQIAGSQTVEWEDQIRTIPQMLAIYQNPDRTVREAAWQQVAARQFQDRQAINELWQKFLAVRGYLAKNSGLPGYRDYRWKQLYRFDYSPADCQVYHEAILQVVVPAVSRICAKRRRRLGLSSLRPWDLAVDPLQRPPLKPYSQSDELVDGCQRIFHQVDPQLGEHFEIMRREQLLDVESRPNKTTGGICVEYLAAQRPFILMNGVGIHEDVLTLLHEGGHAFHLFESAGLPYHFQRLKVPMEFAEVASIGMEYLGSAFLNKERGGFYTPAETARVMIERLKNGLHFLPYMAVVDAFQHWVYSNTELANDSDCCDQAWAELWQRFMPFEDWSGLEEVMKTGWQRKLHIHQDPFYYIEYGLAEMGALQIWMNFLEDPHAAVAAYRRGLALGNTASLPDLYAAAGARFAWDKRTLKRLVDFIELKITQLEESANH